MLFPMHAQWIGRWTLTMTLARAGCRPRHAGMVFDVLDDNAMYTYSNITATGYDSSGQFDHR